MCVSDQCLLLGYQFMFTEDNKLTVNDISSFSEANKLTVKQNDAIIQEEIVQLLFFLMQKNTPQA